MGTPLRAIETDDRRFVQYALDSGEEYFVIDSSAAAPTTLETTSQKVNLIPYSILSAYKNVEGGLVFMSNGPAGITVTSAANKTVLTPPAPAVFLFKTKVPSFSSLPLPLVTTTTTPAEIRERSDAIRLATSHKKLLSMYDFEDVLGSLNKAVTKAVQEADAAVRVADESLSFLVETLATLPSTPAYEELTATTQQQMKKKLESYSSLLTLTDTLLAKRQEIEGLTRSLQEVVKPLTRIATDMTIVT